MEKPKLPANEQSRLNTLKALNLLDTSTEERFDRITRIAARLFDMPMALITLLDEQRQWFKSKVGTELTEAPREVSFCGHAILEDKVMVVNNTREDERFSDNPLVINEPDVHFYAGCPIKAPDGSRLGTLCLLDQKPRELSEQDIDSLKDLANIVEHEIASIYIASTDDLTGINNRRGFMQISQQLFNLCCREAKNASLVFMDLDDFKAINDQHGHSEGDRALKIFAEQLHQTFRHSDVVARLSGDEFVVMLYDSDITFTQEIMERFGEILKQESFDQKLPYDIQFSYGVVELNILHHNSVDELLAAGDTVMYQAKQLKKK